MTKILDERNVNLLIFGIKILTVSIKINGSRGAGELNNTRCGVPAVHHKAGRR